MTVKELVEALGLKVFYMEEEDREIDGVYCGDLLSWVMGKCPADAAWVTIMSNQNVAAVAVLCDTACTILSENVQPDAELLERAEKQGVTLLGSDLDEYQLCWRLKEVLG
jgi:serine kinase of HPr protein (carbohydrate metabolism regulator)